MLLSDHFVISFDLLLRKPVREEKKIISRNIKAIDMHDFRTDVHNLLESATQSNSSDPLVVYNTCLRQLLDRHAPFVTRTVTDRTSAPWMTLEIKRAKVQRRLAERKWLESGLTVHREIYVKQRNLVSNMISKAKKDYLCHKIVNSNPVEFSGTVFADEDFVNTVVQKMPQKSCELDPITTSVLYDCLDEIIPIVTSIINKSLSSGVVSQCFKYTLVKPLLKRPFLIPTASNTTSLFPICHSCQRFWSVLS